MADGSVNIDTRLETGNIRRDVQTVNSELGRIGEGMPAAARNMTDAVSSQYDSMGRRIRSVYRGTSDEARRMYTEMSTAHRQQSVAMRGLKDQMMGVQYQYFQMARSSQTYAGTNAQFMAQVQQLGAEQKRINDALINSNRLAMISMLQTAGTMMNMTTQAQRISQNYQRMANPLYSINRAGLAAADSLNQLANRGNAAVLALKMLGPTAGMKDLLNMQMMITQGLMRFQMVALAAVASSVLLYGALHKANMEMNPKYAEAYNNMIEKLTKAFQPMRDAFAAVMIPIYNFVAAMADLIIKFNEAHPVLARFIQGVIMLVPLLTLILSPLAIGIGLWNGMLAAWSSIWMLIGPLVTGLAAMSATVWVVAAAAVGLTMGLTHLWKTNEKFRESVKGAISVVASFGKTLLDLGKYLFWAAASGDNMNDWLTHLPKGFQNIAQAIGEAIVKVREFVVAIADLTKYLFWAVVSGDSMNDWLTHLPSSWQKAAQAVGESLSSFNAMIGVLVDLGKYLFWVVVSGDTFNDWLTHLPAGLQGVAQIMAQQIEKIKEVIRQLMDAIKLAFQGDFSGLAQTFSQIAPMIVGFLIGGIPSIILAAARFLPAIAQGITSALPVLVSTITTIINNLVTAFTTYLPMLVQVGIQILTTIISGLTQALPIIVQSLVGIMTSLITLISQTLTTLLPLLLNAGIQILMAIINGIVQNLPLIITAAIQMINQLANAIVVNLPLILNAGIQILMALINGIVQMLPMLIQTAVDLLTQISNMIIQNLPMIINAGIQILISLVNGIIQVLPQLIDAAVKLITQIVSTIVQNLPQIISAGVQILTALVNGIIQILPLLISTALRLIVQIAQTIISNLPQILSAGVRIIQALISGILQMVGSLLSAVGGSVIDAIKGPLQKVDLASIGRNIIQGLVNGIKSMAGSVASAISSVAGNIKDKITSALNIHSPSRWMRDMIGKNMMLGWQIGIDREKNPTLKKAEEMTDWFKPNLPDMQSSYDGGYGLGSSSNSVTNNSPVNITLNYSGDASKMDVLSMVDMIEQELQRRFNTSLALNGVK